MTDHRTFTVTGPVYLPCHNRWAEDVYTQTGGFDLDPVDAPAWSTSGSPVLVMGDLFVGVLDPRAGGSFHSDGDRLRVSAPPDGRLFVREGQDPLVSWREYNAAVCAEHPDSGATAGDFVDAVEYCTWVEQKRVAADDGLHGPLDALTGDFILGYLERIDRLGFPPGKVTVDVGWSPRSGPGGFGDWDVATDRVPDLGRIAEVIEDAGHVAGLWFAPGRADVGSRYFHAHPDRSAPVDNTSGEVPLEGPAEYYAQPTEELAEHYRRVFSHYSGLGFRKFKLDMHYGRKTLMRDQLALCYRAIKESDSAAEIEHHIPDIFVSRFSDAIRTNDVLISPGRDWRALTLAHWKVCDLSSPDKVLNLDHVGGNDHSVDEHDYLAHWAMYPQQRGHPVISLLPDRYSRKAIDTVHEGLWRYHTARRSNASAG